MDELDARLEKAWRTGAIAVGCPGCGGEAGFRDPFLFLSGGLAEAAAEDPGVMGVRESGGYLVELYPDVFLASDPARGGVRGKRDGSFGVLLCLHCGHRVRYRLRWPRDAFYKVELGDDVIWAFTREHAEDNLQLLETLDLLPRILRPMLKDEVLSRLPEVVLEAKARRDTIAGLRACLARAEDDRLPGGDDPGDGSAPEDLS